METQLVNFTIPSKLLKNFDQLANKEMRSRSELIREAIRFYLNLNPSLQTNFSYITKAAKRNNLSEKQAINLVDEIRHILPINQ